MPAGEGGSHAPRAGAGSPNSQSTRSMLQDLAFAGRMDYARPQIQGTIRPWEGEKNRKLRQYFGEAG